MRSLWQRGRSEALRVAASWLAWPLGRAGYFSASLRKARATSWAVEPFSVTKTSAPRVLWSTHTQVTSPSEDAPHFIFPPRGPGSTALGAGTFAPTMNDLIVSSGDLSDSWLDCTPRKTNSAPVEPLGAYTPTRTAFWPNLPCSEVLAELATRSANAPVCLV